MADELEVGNILTNPLTGERLTVENIRVRAGDETERVWISDGFDDMDEEIGHYETVIQPKGSMVITVIRG
jgi:hypothetical protein